MFARTVADRYFATGLRSEQVRALVMAVAGGQPPFAVATAFASSSGNGWWGDCGGLSGVGVRLLSRLATVARP
ncbi:MAG TPA: hypothetical protein VMP11_00885, partial [Verrucomicrobiae bacterium]|nr:hypothetical protein [Verrucomicrobiae bacterium]